MIIKIYIFLKIKMYKLFPKKKDRIVAVSGFVMLVPFILLYLLGVQFELRDYIGIGIAIFAIFVSIANSFIEYLIGRAINLIRIYKERKAKVIIKTTETPNLKEDSRRD